MIRIPKPFASSKLPIDIDFYIEAKLSLYINDGIRPNELQGIYNGVHLIVIDGGADFCQSVNDDKEAAAAVEYFTHLSIEYDCPVIIVVHQNPGSEKERGHFGSEIQRKCYGLISIVKTGDISTASVKVGRKAGTTDTPLIHYCNDSTKGYHTNTEEPDIDHNKAVKNRKKHLEMAERVFSGQSSYKHNEAVRQIMDVRSCSEKTAKTMLQNMVGWGQVIHQGEFYRKNMTGVTRVIRGRITPAYRGRVTLIYKVTLTLPQMNPK